MIGYPGKEQTPVVLSRLACVRWYHGHRKLIQASGQVPETTADLSCC